MSHRTGVVSFFGLLLATILYVALNTLANVAPFSARLDVTEDRLYTLSQGTHATLANIDEPVDLHLFFSERLGREVPFYAAYGRRVRDLLIEISTVSRGKVILHEHTPVPFSVDEDQAVLLGLQGIPLDEGGELAYFGLAGTNSVDDIQQIPFFQPERETLLEYDLVQIIHTLSNAEPIVVGVLSSLPILGNMQAQMQAGVMLPWAIAEPLKTNFTVINLPDSIDTLPKEINVMMVVHPRALTQRTMYALEQFLFRGGRLLLFIDPRAESDLSEGPDSVSTSVGSIQLLLQQWGVEVPANELVADRSLALRINAGSTATPVPAEYLVWLGVTKDNLAQQDPVTSQLPTLNIASAGHIRHKSDSPLALEPLITSSRNSSLVNVKEVLGLRPDILGVLARFKADDNAYIIAARLSGAISTAFPDGVPPPTIEKMDTKHGDDSEPAQKLSSDGPVNIILVADSDLLEDRFWLRKQEFFGREVKQPIAANADFVINALGNLAGGDELLGLRSRGISQRPFERINALQRQAELRVQDKERELQDQLKATQARIAQLEGVQATKDKLTGEVSVAVSLTPVQRKEIDGLRQEMLATRQQLRDVQRSLRQDVETLESWLQFVNIGLLPLIVLGIAIVLGAIRSTRRRRDYWVNRASA